MRIEQKDDDWIKPNERIRKDRLYFWNYEYGNLFKIKIRKNSMFRWYPGYGRKFKHKFSNYLMQFLYIDYIINI